MTHRVDFYIIKQNHQGMLNFLAKLVDEIYSLSKTVLIWSHSHDESHILNDFLWSFQDDSFLPHEILIDQNAMMSPVVISTTFIKKDVVINMPGQTGMNSEPIDRIIELVYDDEHIRIQGRVKYRRYKDRGCQIQIFHIN